MTAPQFFATGFPMCRLDARERVAFDALLADERTDLPVMPCKAAAVLGLQGEGMGKPLTPTEPTWGSVDGEAAAVASTTIRTDFSVPSTPSAALRAHCEALNASHDVFVRRAYIECACRPAGYVGGILI